MEAEIKEITPDVTATLGELPIMKQRLAGIIDQMSSEEGEFWQKLLKPTYENVKRVREELTDNQILDLMELACCSFNKGLADLIFSDR